MTSFNPNKQKRLTLSCHLQRTYPRPERVNGGLRASTNKWQIRGGAHSSKTKFSSMSKTVNTWGVGVGNASKQPGTRPWRHRSMCGLGPQSQTNPTPTHLLVLGAEGQVCQLKLLGEWAPVPFPTRSCSVPHYASLDLICKRQVRKTCPTCRNRDNMWQSPGQIIRYWHYWWPLLRS